MKIHLCGPCRTAIEYLAHCEVYKFLTSLGDTVTTTMPQDSGFSELLDCEMLCVLTLSGWETDTYVTQELELARKNGLIITFLYPESCVSRETLTLLEKGYPVAGSVL